MMVYNAEPYGYSEKAKALWIEKGFDYRAGSWKEIDQTKTFQDVEVLIVRLQRKVTEQTLDKFPNLVKLVSATTGWDHIDISSLKARNIELVSLRGQDEFLKTIPSTAEHTWALLMALIRNIPKANEDVKSGNWNRDAFRGFELKGKTLGIIGYGRTGQRVASYADAFEMKVVFYDPYMSNTPKNHHRVNSLEELIQQSDVVSIHVHLSSETENLLSAEMINKLRHGAFLINTSRGKVWDEKAIVDRLEQGHIAGVAADVLQTELEDITNSSLWQAQHENQNIIVTPHIGGATWDAMWACEDHILEISNE